MKRGDLVTIAMQGDFGKPRPAVVLQSDKFSEHATVTILPISSSLINTPLFRITIQPNEVNNLQKTSQIMIDKIMTLKKEKLSKPFGIVSPEVMLEVTRCLAIFIGIAN